MQCDDSDVTSLTTTSITETNNLSHVLDLLPFIDCDNTTCRRSPTKLFYSQNWYQNLNTLVMNYSYGSTHTTTRRISSNIGGTDWITSPYNISDNNEGDGSSLASGGGVGGHLNIFPLQSLICLSTTYAERAEWLWPSSGGSPGCTHIDKCQGNSICYKQYIPATNMGLQEIYFKTEAPSSTGYGATKITSIVLVMSLNNPNMMPGELEPSYEFECKDPYLGLTTQCSYLAPQEIAACLPGGGPWAPPH